MNKTHENDKQTVKVQASSYNGSEPLRVCLKCGKKSL